MRAWLAVLLVFVPVACVGDQTGPTRLPEAAEGDDVVPDWFQDREPLDSCGVISADETSLESEKLKRANECLLEAFDAGEPVEYEVERLTSHGDPTYEIIRVVGEQKVEVLKDTRQDAYGNGAFYYAECTSLAEERPRRGPWVYPGNCTYDESRTLYDRDLVPGLE